jgi:hypothetical protein
MVATNRPGFSNLEMSAAPVLPGLLAGAAGSVRLFN